MMATETLSDLDPVAKDKSYIKVNEVIVSSVLRLKELYPIRLILDLASGTGLITKTIFSRARGLGIEPSIVCIDFDIEALKTARANFANDRAAMIAGRAQNLPVRGQFDLVFFCNSIHMLDHEDKAAALGEINRVLRPGGHLVLSTSYYDGCYPEETKRFYLNWVKKALSNLSSKNPNRERGERVAAMDWLNAEQYAELLERSGFRIAGLKHRKATLSLRTFGAISEYKDFAMGALRAVEKDSKAASQALKDAILPAFRASGLRRVSRNWLEIVAQKA